MNRIYLLSLAILTLLACESNLEDPIDVINPIENGGEISDENNSPEGEMGIAPAVQTTATFEMTVQQDLVYAEGLSHESTNSETATAIPLTLDVYAPVNDSKNRPAILFIHGGGFIGGSKRSGNIINMGNYYASRGFVFISIDYRLLEDQGTVPQEWAAYTPFLDPSIAGQYLAIYPAQRDAKAALRWVFANVEAYSINPDYVTVGGGSAGAVTALTLGISDTDDFTTEISSTSDPTLSTTNLDTSYKVSAILDFWGSAAALNSYEQVYGVNRFDANDPPLFIVHGTEDATVSFSEAEALKSIYEANNLSLAYYPLQGEGHSAWNATEDGKPLEELAFDFIVEQLGLVVE